jgi:hypothetical protein
MDLIDMQAQAYEGYTFILHYQDHLTKFSYLRPLKNKMVSKENGKEIEISITELTCGS